MLAWYLDTPRGVAVSGRARVSQYTLWALEADSLEEARLEDEKAQRRPCILVRRRDTLAEMPVMVRARSGEPWPRAQLWCSRHPDRTERWFALFADPEAR